MSFLRHWKIMLCLAAIFVAGLVSGSLVTLRIVKKAAGRTTTGARRGCRD